MEKTITIYPIAWLKVSKLFAECGTLALGIKDWKPDIQEVFRAMHEAGILDISERTGFIKLKKRLPAGFRDQVKKYA